MRSSTFPFRLAPAAAVLVLCAAPATAQTRFTWPDTAVDLTTYTTPEACQAAVDRTTQDVRDRDALRRGVWRDTLVFDRSELSTPPAAAETARACLTRFADAGAVALEDYRLLLPLYLAAGWTDRARVLAERHLAEAGPDDERALAAAADSVIGLFGLSAGITPWAELEPRVRLLDELLATHMPSGVGRLRAYWKEWEKVAMAALVNETVVDTVTVRQLATRILDAADSLTPYEREVAWEEATSEWRLRIDDPEGLSERLAGAFDYALEWPAFLDSLRHSTASYVQVVRAARERATGRPPEAYIRGQAIGERAPALDGDVWLGCDGPCEPRPAPGRVSLVIFLSHARCTELPVLDNMMYGNCARQLTALRRVMDRFPELDVTVVAAARGHVGYTKEAVTGEREAELIRQWLDSFELQRAVLTMTEPEYWRLPNHDGRRIDPDVANYTNYTFGRAMQVNNALAFLIDQDGIVVHDWLLLRETASEFVERIEILLERGGAAS